MTTMKKTTEKLSKLRSIMKEKGISAYIIPSEDAHQSEYIAQWDARRAYISHFTGSAGLAVVTQQHAALWTDGRYFNQASKQLDENWILQKSGLPKVPSKEDWLNQVLPESSWVGIDPKLITISSARTLKETLAKKGHQMKLIQENLIDLIWHDKPRATLQPIECLDVRYAGVSFEEKLKQLCSKLVEKKAWGVIVSSLDEIAWLFNLRGSDIAYNPVFFAYALVTRDGQAVLYIDCDRVPLQVKESLGNSVQFKAYDAIFEDLKLFKKEKSGEKLWMDSRCNLALQDAIGGSDAVIEEKSPIAMAKSIKNPTELEGFRQCHIRDAVALCRYFAWLENELIQKKNFELTEVSVADQLEVFRSELSDFMGLSFDTISSIGANAAIIHYKPLKETCATLNTNEIYLCDSGAQYRDGTTDVTRTMHFGTPTEEEKDAFTRVLKGHIQLDMTIFPPGTTGYLLDVIARTALWKAGLDYRHGTGHGVGHFLNVHEGPQCIAPRLVANETPLEVGMTVTNEPGFYLDGKFGIRIENIMLVKQAETAHQFGDKPFLCFEHVTLVPIQTKLVNASLLTPEEKNWLNQYHQKVYQTLSPLLTKDQLALDWLKRETQPI